MTTRAHHVLAAAYGLHDCKIEQIQGGVTNVTHLVTAADGAQYIAQKLNPIFTTDSIADYANISSQLIEKGWELQELVPALDGQLYAIDNQDLWQLLTYIPADPPTEHRTIELMHDAGALLARIHRDLAHCTHKPTYKIPHFHDTAYLLDTLAKLAHQLSGEAHALAHKVLAAYRTLDPLPTTPTQLIHGDPRTTNMLYRDGLPFTYVDFDAVMVSTIWIDLGDLLRAACGDDTQTQARFNRDHVDAVIAGYTETLEFNERADQFSTLAWIALQTIALELSSRFLIDIVQDEHFGWDESRYTSRKEHNLARAKAQFEIYTACNT